MEKAILEKRILDMTGEELFTLMAEALSGKNEESTTKKDFTVKQFVYGIEGLRKLLGCGKTKATSIIKSGVIDEAITTTGRKPAIDAELALQLLKSNKEPIKYAYKNGTNK